jgi:uncharacterized NAD(P)/FAD-binding protein YdhS
VIQVDVGIIGGGFSGCAVAAQLGRRASGGLSLALFEPDELGRGAAYGTPHVHHLLNTRAHLMSLFPDDPDHFVRWLGPRAGRTDFVSRRLYGDYVREIAHRAFEHPRFMAVRDRVRSVRPGEDGLFVIETELGTRFEAQAVVLATGNPLPADAFLAREVRMHPGYVGDPWRFDYRVVGGHVLVIGSGLSSLDVLVALNASGHRGAVHIVSRHARFPEVHADVAPYDVIPALDTHDARSALRSFRRHVKQAHQRGFDWRSVVDAIRPEAETLWRRLPPLEKRRFERHLRGRWERHRHRAPQQVDAVRQTYEQSGRLRSYAGQIVEMDRGNVSVALRGGGAVSLRPDWIVNCSGVGRASTMERDPLIGGMLADGMVLAEPRGFGLRANQDLVAVGALGLPTERLWITGPPVRGSRFEATAVPELRSMAELVASGILAKLNSASQTRVIQCLDSEGSG